MHAPALLTELQRQGFQLEAKNDRLCVTPRSRLTDELRAAIKMHKRELVWWLQLGITADPDLPGRVRHRFHRTCTELQIDPAPVLRQFDLWRYPEKDLIEMDLWDISIVEKHCQLLADEARSGFEPYPTRKETSP